MKLRKYEIMRPEIEVEFSRPILGRLFLLVHLPKLFKMVRMNISVYDPKHKEIRLKTIYYFAIPKIKVVNAS